MNYYMRYYFDNFHYYFENRVAIRHGTCFSFMGCKVKFYQLPFEDRCILVSCCGDTLTKNLAEEKMINALKILSFLFAINIASEGSVVWESNIVLEENQLLSKKAKNILQNVERKIERFNLNLDFFYEIINLLCIAYENLFNDRDEDAFIYFFKIIEKISKKHYLIYMQRHHTVKASKICKTELRNFLVKYSIDFLNVELTEDMINRKVDMIYKNLKIEFYGNVFSKISLFVKRHKIKIDIDVISKLVKIRNKTAHGDSIEQNILSDYLIYCEYLANEMIAYHFFHKDYLKLHLKSYRYYKGEDIYLLKPRT